MVRKAQGKNVVPVPLVAIPKAVYVAWNSCVPRPKGSNRVDDSNQSDVLFLKPVALVNSISQLHRRSSAPTPAKYLDRFFVVAGRVVVTVLVRVQMQQQFSESLADSPRMVKRGGPC